MKSYKIFIFIVIVFALLGIVSLLFPKEGISFGEKNLRFPSFDRVFGTAYSETAVVNVDSVLENIHESFIMTCSDSLLDSLYYYRDFLTLNPTRIYFPDNDFTFFDSLFYLFENAKKDCKLYRIHHYGDSQIEMDRISSVLRQRLQECFGGEGVGLMPAVQKIPSVSISQKSSGTFSRYVMYGDSTTQRASHSRYGIMAHFVSLKGDATLAFRESRHKQAQLNVKKFSRVSLLVGNNTDGFSAQLDCGSILNEIQYLEQKAGVSLLTWSLPCEVSEGVLRLEGAAEIYGLFLDGTSGVALDNNPLRGCSGTIFTKIDSDLLSQSFALLNTKLIILQFGGNMMPSISSEKNIHAYVKRIERQFSFLKEAVPDAKILFIGPSDMSKSVNGELQTWTFLPELNAALKEASLRNGVSFWDMFTVMGGKNSMQQWVKHHPPLAVSDYIHFTQEGAQEIGNALSNSFLTHYEFYKLRQKLPCDSVLNFIKKGVIEK